MPFSIAPERPQKGQFDSSLPSHHLVDLSFLLHLLAKVLALHTSSLPQVLKVVGSLVLFPTFLPKVREV